MVHISAKMGCTAFPLYSHKSRFTACLIHMSISKHFSANATKEHSTHEMGACVCDCQSIG